MRTLGNGILKEGFTINNSIFSVKIPKTTVVFGYDSDIKAQIITFPEFPELFLFRKAFEERTGKWLANVYGQLMTVHLDQLHPPYPISYFRD